MDMQNRLDGERYQREHDDKEEKERRDKERTRESGTKRLLADATEASKKKK